MAVGHQSVGGFNLMAKLNTAKGKLVRKLGENIFGNPKYDRLLNRKPYSPGQHGQSRRGKLSNYGVQLQEKQKIKFMYGLLEKQFRLNFEKAEKMTGETGTNMLQLLESRLDNVLYSLGFAPSRPSARQLVSHKHFLINNKIVKIPSYCLKPGDIIECSNAILKLSRNKILRKKYGKNSRKLVEGDMALEHICSQYYSLYKEMM